eukprot:SM000058S18527  [mRNA]  locus=s58:350391:356348:- [translate_table: standard]
MAAAGFRPGQRVRVAAAAAAAGDEAQSQYHAATVRYVGPVAGQAGDWLGVDWDDPSRGRHSGDAGGVSHFAAAVPGGASFVRPSRTCAGVSLLAALEARYTSREPTAGADDMYILSSGRRRLPIELVGRAQVEAQQARLDRLRVAYLPGTGVVSAGCPGELRAAAGNLRELFISGHLLSHWEDVSRICQELPMLETLDLSDGRLLPAPPLVPGMAGLKILVLNNCNLQWKDVQLLSTSIPRIQELHLCSNLIKDLQLDTARGCKLSFPLLRLLDLEGNQIRTWDEFNCLSSLVSLEVLNLGGNGLLDVEPLSATEEVGPPVAHEVGATEPPFAKLGCLVLGKCISLLPLPCLSTNFLLQGFPHGYTFDSALGVSLCVSGNNSISTMAAIDALNTYSALKDVRLTGNPITHTTSGAAQRYMVVARVKGLKVLNGGEITPHERRDSEIRYIHEIMSQESIRSKEDIQREHPRYKELLQLHQVEQSMVAVPSRRARALADDFLTVTLNLKGDGDLPPKQLTKKLPGSTTVGRLKLLCHRLFGFRRGSHISLQATSADGWAALELTDDRKTLADVAEQKQAFIVVSEGADYKGGEVGNPKIEVTAVKPLLYSPTCFVTASARFRRAAASVALLC